MTIYLFRYFKRRLLSYLFITVICLHVRVLFAEDSSTPVQQENWLNSHPEKISADWLQLVSGEWLRGSIISLHDDKLEFDSDKLDEHTIKLKDIRYLKSAHPYSLRFEESGNNTSAKTNGYFEIIRGRVKVFNDYHNEEYPLQNIISIASGDESELSFWKAKATLSLNIRRGNTNQSDFAAQVNAKRRTTFSRLTLAYLGNFSSTESIQTANNHRANANFDIFINRRFFWNVIFSEYFRDTFQNIDARFLAGSGLGYNIIDTNETEWTISGGPGIKQTRYVTTEADRRDIENTAFIAAATDYKTELNSKVDLIGKYSFNIANQVSGGYTHHALGTIETELTKRLDFDVTFVWDRIENPAAKSDGTVPDKNDFKLLVGLDFEL